MPHFVKRKRGGGREKGRKERSKPGRRSLVHTRGQGQIERQSLHYSLWRERQPR